MKDDRRPIVLVVLDGLGDRACPTLGGRTPSEAARTPILDALCTRGACGVHVPFGPGRATSSETAHWSMFGFNDVAFPGRAAIEALGVGLEVPSGTPMFHLALRAGRVRDAALFLGERADREADVDDAGSLFAALEGRRAAGIDFELLPLRTGESVLIAHGAPTYAVSDSDALFDHVHPWMRPLALDDAPDRVAAHGVAAALERWLLDGHTILKAHPTNRRRREQGQPALDVPVTKWASWIDLALPSFAEHIGIDGGCITDTALYRGLASILNMRFVDIAYDRNSPADDMAARLTAAEALLDEVDFVHVHIKATDEAGHRKNPEFKRDVIAATDEGLEGLVSLAERAVVAVTGDHATPSHGAVLHTGDPTPFVVAGPDVSPDETRRFGESHALKGACGRLSASDIMPLLAGLANRPAFRGHRPGATTTVALPNAPEAMPLQQPAEKNNERTSTLDEPVRQ